MGIKVRILAFLFLWVFSSSSAMEKKEQGITPDFDEYHEWYNRLISVLNTLPFELTQYHKEHEGMPILGNFGPVSAENYRKYNFEFLVVTVPVRALDDPKLSSLSRFFKDSASVSLIGPPYCISERIDDNFVCRFQVKSCCDMYLTQRVKKDFSVKMLSPDDKLRLLDTFF